MGVPIYVLPSHMCVMIQCVDDSLPEFEVENWIKENKFYRLKQWADALNKSEKSYTIIDEKGKEIWPNQNYKGFSSERFVMHPLFQFCLN